MSGDRRVRAHREHRGERRDLVRITAVGKLRKQHHRKPHRGEDRGGDDAQVQSGDHQQMRHAGAREYLPQRIADVALVADHERAHLGVLGVSKVAIEELTDVGPYRFNLAGGKYRTMPDDLKQRRTERLFRRGHGGVDAVARHQPCVVELAWIAVVAREVNPRAQPYFVAELEIATAQHCDSDVAAARQHRCALFGGSIDSHVQPSAVGFVLGLAIYAAFDRNARSRRSSPRCYAPDAKVRGCSRPRHSLSSRLQGKRRRGRAFVAMRENCRARRRRASMRATTESPGESCRARRR